MNKYLILFIFLLLLISTDSWGNPLLLTSREKRKELLEKNIPDHKALWRYVLQIHLNSRSYVDGYIQFVQGSVNQDSFDPIGGHKSCDVTTLVAALMSKNLGHANTSDFESEVEIRRINRFKETGVDPSDEIRVANHINIKTKVILNEIVELDDLLIKEKILNRELKQKLNESSRVNKEAELKNINEILEKLKQKYSFPNKLGEILNQLGIGEKNYSESSKAKELTMEDEMALYMNMGDLKGFLFSSSSLDLLRDYLLTRANSLEGRNKTPFPSREKLANERQFIYQGPHKYDPKKFPPQLAPHFVESEIIRPSQNEIVQRDYDYIYEKIKGTELEDIANLFDESETQIVRDNYRRHIKWISMNSVIKEVFEQGLPIALVVHDTKDNEHEYDLSEPYDYALYGKKNDSQYENLEVMANALKLNPNEEAIVIHIRRPKTVNGVPNENIDEFLIRNNLTIFDLLNLNVASYNFESWSSNFVNELNKKYKTNLKLELNEFKGKFGIDSVNDQIYQISGEFKSDPKLEKMVHYFNNSIAPLQVKSRFYKLCRNPNDITGNLKTFETNDINASILHMAPGRVRDFPFVRNVDNKMVVNFDTRNEDYYLGAFKNLLLKQNVKNLVLNFNYFFGRRGGYLREINMFRELSTLNFNEVEKLTIMLPDYNYNEEQIMSLLYFFRGTQFPKLKELKLMLPGRLLDLHLDYLLIENNSNIKSLSINGAEQLSFQRDYFKRTKEKRMLTRATFRHLEENPLDLSVYQKFPLTHIEIGKGMIVDGNENPFNKETKAITIKDVARDKNNAFTLLLNFESENLEYLSVNFDYRDQGKSDSYGASFDDVAKIVKQFPNIKSLQIDRFKGKKQANILNEIEKIDQLEELAIDARKILLEDLIDLVKKKGLKKLILNGFNFENNSDATFKENFEKFYQIIAKKQMVVKFNAPIMDEIKIEHIRRIHLRGKKTQKSPAELIFVHPKNWKLLDVFQKINQLGKKDVLIQVRNPNCDNSFLPKFDDFSKPKISNRNSKEFIVPFEEKELVNAKKITTNAFVTRVIIDKDPTSFLDLRFGSPYKVLISHFPLLTIESEDNENVVTTSPIRKIYRMGDDFYIKTISGSLYQISQDLLKDGRDKRELDKILSELYGDNYFKLKKFRRKSELDIHGEQDLLQELIGQDYLEWEYTEDYDSEDFIESNEIKELKNGECLLIDKMNKDLRHLLKYRSNLK